MTFRKRVLPMLLLPALALATAVVAFSVGRLFPGVAWSLYEWHFPSKPGAASRVVLAEIDAASLQKYGPWPFDRGLTARAAQNAFDAGAVVVGADLYFPDRRGEAGDRALVDLATKNKQFVIAYRSAGSEPGERFFPELSLAGPSAGYVDVTPKVAEGSLIYVIAHRNAEASLPMALAQRYCEKMGTCQPQLRLSATDMVYGASPKPVWGVNVNVPASAIARIPFHQLLDGKAGSLKDKIVIISPADASLGDLWLVPDGSGHIRQPGTVWVAYGAETLIDDTSIIVMPASVLVLALALGNWLVLGLGRRTPRAKAAWLAGYAVLLLAMHWMLFKQVQVHVPLLVLVTDVACLAAMMAMISDSGARFRRKVAEVDTGFLASRLRR